MSIFIPDFSSTHIFVLGDIMLDEYVWGDVERISPEAPIPVVRVSNRTCKLGGGGNVAANLAGLGCKVTLGGIVGIDEAGKRIASQLSDKKITDKTLLSEHIPTISKTRIMGGSQQIVRLDEERPDLVSDKHRDELLKNLTQTVEQINAVILSDYGKGIFKNGFAAKCIALSRKHGVPVFVDPKSSDWSHYEGAFCITPNLKEFQSICHESGDTECCLEDAGNRLRVAYNLDSLLVTQGASGMTLFSRHGPSLTIPSQAREVFDVSGAGDTVIATLAAGVASGLNLEDSIHLANAAAGVVVGRIGTYAITRSELTLEEQHSAYTSSVCPLDCAKRLSDHWRMTGQTVVFTNGCFDLLHPGHIHLLQKAKKLGDKLIVGLNSDESVRRLKGANRPILSEMDRAAILSALACVDLVVLFSEDTPIEIIQILSPDILVKGSDYSREQVVGHEIVERQGGRVELVSLLEDRSTTGIVERLKE